MKYYSVLFFFSALVTSAFSQETTRDLSKFTFLKVSGGISVELYDGEPEANIKVIKGELKDLITEVNGKELYIKFKSKSGFGWNNNGNRKAKIKLSGAQNLESIDVSAGAYVHSNITLSPEKGDFDASSGASLDVEIESASITGSASSGGSVTLSGTVNKLRCDASSGGSFNAKNLESRKVKADASSGGSAKVWATDYLDAGASSGGNVRYKGNPSDKDINVGKYSGGSVSKM